MYSLICTVPVKYHTVPSRDLIKTNDRNHSTFYFILFHNPGSHLAN